MDVHSFYLSKEYWRNPLLAEWSVKSRHTDPVTVVIHLDRTNPNNNLEILDLRY